MHRPHVLVVDFGGQYSQLIVRRVRELGVYSEMIPWQQADARILAEPPDAIILSGGPRSVLAEGAPKVNLDFVGRIPVLGICFGLQLLAQGLGGKVERAVHSEYGLAQLENPAPRSLVANLESYEVWMSHWDQVVKEPAGSTVIASTPTCRVAAFADEERRLFGVQFHPEVSHTKSGREILRRFLFDHARLVPNWSSAEFISEQIEEIRRRVGDNRVLCAVSGGVDSSVMAALLTEAVGEQAVCVFVDHGLLRKGEAEQVVRSFRDHFKPTLLAIDAREQFFSALSGVTDPEQKRKIIGEQFVRVFQQHADELKECKFLAQGTLYPDVIESGSKNAAKIKTHHNVGGLPEWMTFELIEPLRLLFKDEVRQVGRALGLPEEIVSRQPFPGPGLAVRILGEVTPERVAIVQDADWIFRSELARLGLDQDIWQSYAALLDVRSVGVQGDARTYEHPIVLRAVSSEDAMTASATPIPIEVLMAIATKIVNEVQGVNRVLYDLTSKPPATIEWE
jgi:GMP synthase (glutamine-hydrolysing)